VKQLAEISRMSAGSAPNFYSRQIWLGGLLSPEAFMTATRQAAAQAHRWSLESLELVMEVPQPNAPAPTDRHTFTIQGLSLEGAAFDFATGHLTPDAKLSTALPPARFHWRLKTVRFPPRLLAALRARSVLTDHAG
jgi:dynein heavy chain 1